MATATMTKVVNAELAQFATIFRAYMECKPEIQEIVRDMAMIVDGDDATQEEKENAIRVMVEALFPGLAYETIEVTDQWMKSTTTAVERQQVDCEEQEFAQRVRALMDSKGISQEQLAERTGVSQPAISNMLNRNCRPQRRTITKIAEALGVDVCDLWN